MPAIQTPSHYFCFCFNLSSNCTLHIPFSSANLVHPLGPEHPHVQTDVGLDMVPTPRHSGILIIFKSTTQVLPSPRAGLETSFKPHWSRHFNPSLHVLSLMWPEVSLHFCSSAASSRAAGTPSSLISPPPLPAFSFSE